MNKKITFAINIILLVLAMESEFLLDYKVMGIDLSDIGIISSLCLFSFALISDGNFVLSKFSFGFVLYSIIVFLLSIYRGYDVRYVLADFRNFLFFIFSYSLFRNKLVLPHYVLKVAPFWGLVNSLVFLVNLGILSGNYGRELSTSLWISLFAINAILYYDYRLISEKKKKLIKVFNLISLIVGIITILLSQTRTYIIPLIVMMLIYLLISIKKKSLKSIFVLLLFFIPVFYIAVNIPIEDFIDILLIRMGGILSNESTLMLRINNSLEQLSNMDFIDLILGRGFGERIYVVTYNGLTRPTSDLEMLIPNQILELGIIAVTALYISLMYNLKATNQFNRQLKIAFFSMFLGGIISGFVGMIGSIVFGFIIGLSSNNSRESIIPKLLDE